MDHDNFDAQIKRLESQWQNAYGPERRVILWNAFHSEKTDVFTNAVSDCLAYMRSAPLLDELSKAVEKAKAAEGRSNYSDRNAFQLLQDASKYTKADGDFVRTCLKHISDYQSGKMTTKEFYAGCDALDEMAEKINPSGGKAWPYGAPKYGT